MKIKIIINKINNLLINYNNKNLNKKNNNFFNNLKYLQNMKKVIIIIYKML